MGSSSTNRKRKDSYTFESSQFYREL